MAWFKVDDGFANSRPVLRIPRRYRMAAVGLWTLAGTWSAKELTDGFIPDYVVEELGGSAALADHLVRAGLWERVGDGYQLIGWEKYQPTKAQVLARRSDEAERKKRAREAYRKASEQQESSGVRSGHPPDTVRSPQSVRARSEHPDPTRPDPSLNTSNSPMEVVTSVGARSQANAAPAAKRGTRLPEGWMPPQAAIDAIKAETGATSEQLQAEHRKFADHWLAQAGQRGVKADWTATWRNWMRRAVEQGGFGPARNAPRPAPSDARVAQVQAMKQRYLEQAALTLVEGNDEPRELPA